MAALHTDDPSRAGSLSLVGQALALDFANTASGRGGAHGLDHMRAPEHVVDWAEHAGVVDGPTAAALRERIAAEHRCVAGLLPDALSLREAIHRAVAALAAGQGPDPADLAHLKTACARAIAAAELAPGAGDFRWTWPTDPPVAETVLGPIALSAVGILREGDLSRLKQCGGEHCGWVFFDLTKNRSRRWCDMAVCGNRTKARRHRQRQAFSADDPAS
ncbi:CGNR zinc finger domain-containing protein [Salinarimonas soli]|uniref:Zinc finger CGNR domain-containing protein n=1 Tax=Salinarimonas soli TaxID=1638099 RepID=A0A5B2VDW8_9HYPH|nr:ABATE domain-containing protein [Salinarimonas soli]KAA2236317.1 hypothetical protein F0L46_16585 [Salinarimonas soli]